MPWGTSLPNDFSLSFLVFINIHEYANEIMFIKDHTMKEFDKFYLLCYKNMY